nr:hypothetical protein [uncultured Noviherbaspirillum sp.]
MLLRLSLHSAETRNGGFGTVMRTAPTRYFCVRPSVPHPLAMAGKQAMHQNHLEAGN